MFRVEVQAEDIRKGVTSDISQDGTGFPEPRAAVWTPLWVSAGAGRVLTGGREASAQASSPCLRPPGPLPAPPDRYTGTYGVWPVASLPGSSAALSGLGGRGWRQEALSQWRFSLHLASGVFGPGANVARMETERIRSITQAG